MFTMQLANNSTTYLLCTSLRGYFGVKVWSERKGICRHENTDKEASEETLKGLLKSK